MLVVYGFALVSASVLLIMLVVKVKNAPSAPRWASSKVFLHTALFSSMTAFIFGIALLFDVAVNPANAQFGSLEALLLGAAIAATYFAWRKIRTMGRAAAGKEGSQMKSPGGVA